MSQSMEEVKRTLTTDALRTVDEAHFIYYHPAADANYHTVVERFVAIPNTCVMERFKEEVLWPYKLWYPVKISASDLSSFKSLLPNMKYNIKFREVDPVNGTADLTTIISSSLLSYRLLSHYVWPYDNVNDMPPITTVWQVKLTHRRKGVSIIFMDDRGLFDI